MAEITTPLSRYVYLLLSMEQRCGQCSRLIRDNPNNRSGYCYSCRAKMNRREAKRIIEDD